VAVGTFLAPLIVLFLWHSSDLLWLQRLAAGASGFCDTLVALGHEVVYAAALLQDPAGMRKCSAMRPGALDEFARVWMLQMDGANRIAGD
jgi:hypothetical protein